MMILTMNQRMVFISKASFAVLRPQVAGFFYLEQPFWRTFLIKQKRQSAQTALIFNNLISLNIAFRNKSAIIKYIKGATDKRSAPKYFGLKVSRLTFQGEAAYFFCKSTTRIIKINNVSFMGITPISGVILTAQRFGSTISDIIALKLVLVDFNIIFKFTSFSIKLVSQINATFI